MEKVFETKYPKVDVIREAGGSTKMARMISEQKKSADIMGSAGFAVIDKYLIPEFADNPCDGLFGDGMSLVMSELKVLNDGSDSAYKWPHWIVSSGFAFQVIGRKQVAPTGTTMLL